MKKRTEFTKLISILLVGIMAFTLIAGCTSQKTETDPGTTAPDPTQASASAVGIRKASGNSFNAETDPSQDYIRANNLFTAALVSALDEDSTFVVSPASLGLMLEMLYNGADDAGKQQIALALKHTLTGDGINQNAAALINALETVSKADGASKFTLDTSILVSVNDRFDAGFEAALAENFKASVGNIDFTDTDEALRIINGWVSEKTNGLIDKLLENIYPDTAAALINALYFKGQWQTPFKLNTQATVFSGKKGEQKADFIWTQADYKYALIDGNDVVLVPYAGGDYSMAIVLPKIDASAAGALGAVMENGFEGFETSNVLLSMPCVELETKLDVMELLPALGLGGISDGSMLFPSIVADSPVFINQFVHAATLKIDENGTEASAASAVTTEKSAAFVSDPDHKVDCNRPYAMAIVHNATGAIVFASVVNDLPTE